MKKINKDLSVWMKSGKTKDMKDLVLPRGEFGYDTTKRELKYGDGKTKFGDIKACGKDGIVEQMKLAANKVKFEIGNQIWAISNTDTGEMEISHSIAPSNPIYSLCGFLVDGMYLSVTDFINFADTNSYKLTSFETNWGKNRQYSIYTKSFSYISPVYWAFNFDDTLPEEPEEPEEDNNTNYGYGY